MRISKINYYMRCTITIIITIIIISVLIIDGCSDAAMPIYEVNFGIYYLQDSKTVFEDLVGKDLSTFKLQDKPWISERDIDYYDFSSHCIYLKKDKSIVFPEYKTFYTDLNWRYKPFIVIAKDKICYAGYFEGNGSIRYNVPKINGVDIIYYPIDVIPLEVLNYLFAKDIRNNEQVKNTLMETNIYRAGISVELEDIIIYNSDISTIEYTIIIKNNDTDNLYVLDPEKTGIELFHYYTNGILLLDVSTEKSYWSKYKKITAPEPWDLFDIKWYTRLETGQSIRRTVILKGYENIPYSNYYCQMLYHAPNIHIEKEKRLLIDGKIWIGYTTTNALDITFDKDNNCRINNRNVIFNK